MIDRDHERELHELLDGSATPEARRRTEAWLATSDEGRRRRSELEALFSELGSLAVEPAPAGLRDGVLASIRSRSGSLSPRRVSRPRWVLLAPIAAILLAVAALPWWHHGLEPGTLPEVTGTMSTAPVAGQSHWRIGRASVSTSLTSEASGVTAEFDIIAPGPVQAHLSAAPGLLSGARLVLVSGSADLAPEGDALALRTDGDARLRVVLPHARPDQRIAITLYADDRRAGGMLPAPAPAAAGSTEGTVKK
jgi:anti-sigma factor RsiW